LVRQLPFRDALHADSLRRHQRRRLLERSRLHLQSRDDRGSRVRRRRAIAAQFVDGECEGLSAQAARLPCRAQQLSGTLDIDGDDVALVQSAQVQDATARDAVAAGGESFGRCRLAVAWQRQAAWLGTILFPRSVAARRAWLRSPDATLSLRCESEIWLYPASSHCCKSACHCNCNHALRPRTDARAAGAHPAAGSWTNSARNQSSRANAQGDLWQR